MENLTRPFYDEYAWAYDLIITQPVSAQCDFIAETLAGRGIASGAKLLDAGCGVGNHALELARRGYIARGLDLSPQLIAEAERRARNVALPISFTVGDILYLPATNSFDAILCRGVLNDFLDEADRLQAFLSFAGALKPKGLLILDVRDWDATVAGKTLAPVFEKSAETPLGNLTFRSVTRLDSETRRLLVEEQHTLQEPGGEKISAYNFSMRCWTQAELQAHLTQSGFEALEYFGGYERHIRVGASDRLVCVASKV
ncbi:MAG TPA: class I SAM-dependent methyltransferase [Pyrinomonadaceae bacterium]